MTGIVSEAPGANQTLSGGTRTEPKVVRPWQKELVLPNKPEDCPLCTRPQTDEHVPQEGWKTFQNSNTPFPFHRLLIPKDCWPIERLRSLSDPSTLALVFRLALAEIERVKAMGDVPWPMWIFTHVGYGAGQNFPHPHWHLCGAPAPPRSLLGNEGSEERVALWRSNDLETQLCGVRAGQALIRPTTEQYRHTFALYEHPSLVDQVAADAHLLVRRFNEKFKNPDFCLMLALNGRNEWFVRYTPILNNWGGSEFAALDHGTPFVLPWPHESTKEFLLRED